MSPARNPHFSFRNVRQGFSRFAGSYDSHAHLQQNVLVGALQELEPYLKPDMHILDGGCGTGYLLELLRNTHMSFRIQGLDFAPGMCTQAARRHVEEGHEFRVVCGDLQAMPYKDAIFDMVISSLAMQWIFPRREALDELYRTLKPGGYAIVTSFGPMTLQELRWAFSEVDDFPHVSEFADSNAVSEWARQSGFTIGNLRTEFIVNHYASVQKLMTEIRAIGASNKLADRRKTMTGRNRFQQMETVYKEAYETERGIPASWEILYILLRKPL